MKRKKALQKALSFLMAFVMTFSLVPLTAYAEGKVTIEKFTDDLVTGEYVMAVDDGEVSYATGNLENGWVLANQLDKGNKTTVSKDSKVTLTVEGDKVKIQDNTGKYLAPKGGNTNGILEKEYQWAFEKTEEGNYIFKGINGDTVTFASNKANEYKFRAYKNTTINAGYPHEFTLYTVINDDPSDVKVAAPQVSPQSGEVAKNTAITLSTTTEGAKIYFTLDGSDPKNSNTRVEYSSANQPTIVENCTLKAVAELNGTYSEVQTQRYTVAAEETNDGPIADGDQVVIYAPAYNKALSGTYTGFYNNGTDVTVSEDGTVTGFNPANDVWTVEENNDDTFSFVYNGQKLAMGDQFSSMPLGENNDKWVLEEAENGCWYVKNTVRNSYIEWYADKNNWSSFGSIGAGKEDQFSLKFFKIEGGTTPDPEEPNEIQGLEVEASPVNGASVQEGDTITLKAAEGTEIYYTKAEDGAEPADPEVTEENKYTEDIVVNKTPERGKNLNIKAIAYKPATDDTEAETGEVYTFTYKAPVALGDYGLYFGQLHSHTNISDGTGSVEQAFEHAADVPNLDFLAVTDHSNSFDGATPDQKIHLGDAEAESVNAEWGEGRKAARDITAKENGTFVGLYGFEMTWSGGAPGHINTFNSEGFESRNMEPYKKGDNYKVLDAYFNTLNENPETISQFNHPGDTFGDFMDFALYSPVTDNQMTMVEVGNGEGAIGASGYFPSYSYYTRALDKGWHVAPTNNQDNHKGNWGDSNTARTVVLADGLTEDSIYDAIKNYRVYATEDNDLSILYSLNGNAMGSILGKQDNVDINVSLNDPTDTTGTTKVEVIVNGGRTLAEKTYTGGTAELNFTNLPADYSYYYLRVTQPDKNVAVTAPVWVGEGVNAGVSNTSSDVAMPIKGDEVTLSSQIYNNMQDDMTVKSLTYTLEGQEEPFKTADVTTIGNNGVVGARQSFTYSFPYTVEQAGGFNVNVKLVADLDGQEYTFTDVLKLKVSDPTIATKVLIDGTHYNDYVNGYYSGNMGNFINMGTQDNIQVKIAQPGTEITANDLKDVTLLVVSAPLKYTSEYTGDAKPSVFEQSFINVVSDYVNNGGTAIVTGLADYQDSNDGLPYTSYEQANNMLKGIGSTMRINDDELIDKEDNGGQPYRLYFDDYNYESKDPFVQQMLNGVRESGLKYSSYSGCSINAGKGTPVVFGHDTTYSINSKAPAQGHDKPVLSYSAPYDENTAVIQKGDVVSLATEPVGKGHVIAAGTVFISNFEVSAEDQVSYSNGIMAKNILNTVKKEPTISTIETARHGKEGQVFTVKGTVASGTADSKNAFFNTIYIQDEEGNGINVFPIDDNSLRVGDQVQVTGSISSYIGDKQLSAISVKTLEGQKPVKITETSLEEADNYDKNFGKLVKVEGKVKEVRNADGLIDNIILTNNKGEEARVFIDGYIGYSSDESEKLESFVKEGQTISAVGFVSHDAEGNRLRVRDRSEIVRVDVETDHKPQGQMRTVSFHIGDNLIKQTIEDGLTLIGHFPEVPAKEGYTFVGWNTKEDGTGETVTDSTPITADMDVYAIYEKNPELLPTEREVNVEFVTEDNKVVGNKKLTLPVENGTTAKLSDLEVYVPEGYELAQSGDLYIAFDADSVQVSVRKKAEEKPEAPQLPTTIDVTIQFLEDGKNIVSEQKVTLPVENGTIAHYADVEKYVPEGFELSQSGDFYVDYKNPNSPVKIEVRRKAVTPEEPEEPQVPVTVDVELHFVEDGKDVVAKEKVTLPVENGTVAHYADVEKYVPAGYELCNAGDFYVDYKNPNEPVIIAVRRIPVTPEEPQKPEPQPEPEQPQVPTTVDVVLHFVDGEEIISKEKVTLPVQYGTVAKYADVEKYVPAGYELAQSGDFFVDPAEPNAPIEIKVRKVETEGPTEPQKPETPENKPEAPQKPEAPENKPEVSPENPETKPECNKPETKPEAPQKPNTEVKPQSGVQTGDKSNMGLWIGICVVAIVVGGVAFYFVKKKK